MKKIQAWHFIHNRTLRFTHNDKENVRIRKGQTLHVEPPLEMCSHGLHASINPLDALRYYNNGDPITVCRVELWGTMIKGDDKICAEFRKVLWHADCTNTLHLFACWCAEETLKLVDKPDPRSVAAIEVKRKWVDGKATDDELAAAGAAAWAAARDAAWDAAWAAARATAWDTASDAQNHQLIHMLKELSTRKGVNS